MQYLLNNSKKDDDYYLNKMYSTPGYILFFTDEGKNTLFLDLQHLFSERVVLLVSLAQDILSIMVSG